MQEGFGFNGRVMAGGHGTVSFTGGTLTDAGSYDVTGSTTVSGGTANLSGALAHLGSSITASVRVFI